MLPFIFCVLYSSNQLSFSLCTITNNAVLIIEQITFFMKNDTLHNAIIDYFSMFVLSQASQPKSGKNL